MISNVLIFVLGLLIGALMVVWAWILVVDVELRELERELIQKDACIDAKLCEMEEVYTSETV